MLGVYSRLEKGYKEDWAPFGPYEELIFRSKDIFQFFPYRLKMKYAGIYEWVFT